MPDDARLLLALAHDPSFLHRVQYALCKVALVVAAEPGATPNHAARRVFAAEVLGNPEAAAATTAVALVASAPNLTATVTIDAALTVETSVSDDAIIAQVTNLWNAFAGV